MIRLSIFYRYAGQTKKVFCIFTGNKYYKYTFPQIPYHQSGGHYVLYGKKLEGVDKLMTSRHLCAIRLHERKTAMP